MKDILMTLAFLLISLLNVNGQFVVFTNTEVGGIIGAQATNVQPQEQFLMPSIFWSPRKVDLQLSRKWWRNSPEIPAVSNNGLTRIITHNGAMVWAEPIVEGYISLYREPISFGETSILDQENSKLNFSQSSLTYRYWIGDHQLVMINDLNYRNVIKGKLKAAEDLHQKLGKKGFKFENTPSMVLYYNSFYSNEPFTPNKLKRGDLLLN